MKKIFASFFIFFVFFLMLAFPTLTKDAAHEGLELWMFKLLPALLPYTIISSILLYINAFSLPCKLLSKIFRRPLPEHEIFTCICGLLCGCPIGAKIAADNYIAGKLSKAKAEFLICAFNCISPSFLINYVFVEVYAPYMDLNPINRWLLFGILVASSVAGSAICYFFPDKSYSNKEFYSANSNQMNKRISFGMIIDNCILSSFEIQVKIGGYIILFTIITELFLYTLNLSWLSFSILGSLLEITSGLDAFSSINNSIPSQISSIIPSIITSLTAFGGICTIFQTKTVVSSTDLSISKYTVSKIISGILAFALTYLIL